MAHRFWEILCTPVLVNNFCRRRFTVVTRLFKIIQILNPQNCLQTDAYFNLVTFKFYSGRNLGQIEVRQCLVSFSAESVVFQFAVQKYED